MRGTGKSWCQVRSLICLDRFCRYMRKWMTRLKNGQELKTHTYHGMVQKIGPAPKVRMICQGAFDRRLFAIFWKIQDFVQICTLKSRTTKGFTKKTKNHSILRLTIVSAPKASVYVGSLSLRLAMKVTGKVHGLEESECGTHRIHRLVYLRTFIGKCERNTDPMGYKSWWICPRMENDQYSSKKTDTKHGLDIYVFFLSIMALWGHEVLNLSAVAKSSAQMFVVTLPPYNHFWNIGYKIKPLAVLLVSLLGWWLSAILSLSTTHLDLQWWGIKKYQQITSDIFELLGN